MLLAIRPSDFAAFSVFFRTALNAHSRAAGFDLSGARLLGLGHVRRKNCCQNL